MRILLGLSAYIFPALALAHEGEKHAGELPASGFWDRLFWSDALPVVYIASLILVFLLAVILLRPPKSHGSKVFFFGLMSLVIVSITFFIAGGTIYQNVTSATGGPVHWHADFRVFNCAEELDLISPEGFANRVGSADVHEHGDGRIHIEGKIKTLSEASLHGFFEAVGGTLKNNEIAMPTDDGIVYMRNGDRCPDGKEGIVQAFLWKTQNGEATQRKLENFPEYVISPENIIPPGDCVILEFGQVREKTEHACLFYEIAGDEGDIKLIR